MKNEILQIESEIAEKNKAKGKTNFTSSFNLEDDDSTSKTAEIEVSLFTKSAFHKEYKIKVSISKVLLNSWKLSLRETYCLNLSLKEGFSPVESRLGA